MATMTKDPVAPALAASPEHPDPMPSRDERRSHDRFDVEWSVDCVAEDTFLYASITNISAMGIFVKTTDPLAIGTRLVLSFAPPGYEPFKLEGEVAWINPLRSNGDNPNPGIGVRFVNLLPDDRERLVEVIRTIAYVREP
jgi:type IV pilus assembly protein PilZ